jgi:cyclopropane-fatty-acyl-phospholipid synthase
MRTPERVDNAPVRHTTRLSSAWRPRAVPRGASPTSRDKATEPTVAEALHPVIQGMLGHEIPVRFEFWDGSAFGPSAGAGSVVVSSPDALRYLLWAPGELGLARAFVTGGLEFRGDFIGVLQALNQAAPPNLHMGVPVLVGAVRAARHVGALGLPPQRLQEEASARGLKHTKKRDAQVISHHYDISNDFYGLVLGPSMTYSCARFTDSPMSLEDAQAAKHDLVCRKLGLDQRPDMRLLDVGCGWGSMALHAAHAFDAKVVGVTLSEAQADLARRRVHEAGLDGRIEIRMQDYRDLVGEHFDAVSSIGMFEHVGTSNMDRYFETLCQLLNPTGRLLNHAISSVGGSRISRRSFIGRYVFPDGELIDVGEVVLAMERAGFEVRDLESLREHYAKTLESWVHNLQDTWARAVSLVGTRRARVWLLYMAASANGFLDGGISIHQVLGVKPGSEGVSLMPATRRAWS